MSETEEYHLYPKNKDCIYTTEHWNNQLSNGKSVTVLYVQQWRNGEFTIELDEKDKAKILTNDNIILRFSNYTIYSSQNSRHEKIFNTWQHNTNGICFS